MKVVEEILSFKFSTYTHVRIAESGLGENEGVVVGMVVSYIVTSTCMKSRYILLLPLHGLYARFMLCSSLVWSLHS